MNKKVLILGNSAKEYALAKKLSENCQVFVAPGNSAISEFATIVDIRDNSTRDLLEFCVENNVDMVIPVSDASIKSDISDVFARHNISVFSGVYESKDVLLDKISAKRLLYKLKIPTPRFGIFDKQAMAVEYIKKLSIPFVVKSNVPSSAVILNSLKSNDNILDYIFAQKNGKIIVEDYIYGQAFTFYSITDGYKALPFASSLINKGSLEGEGGQLTSGLGACSPNYKLSLEQENYLMDDVIYPTIEYLQNYASPYLGILGVNGILSSDGTITILGYQPFLQDCDCAGILENLNVNTIDLFNSCIIGSFSDEIDEILTKNMYSVSVVLSCKHTNNVENILTGIENLDDNIMQSFYSSVSKNKYFEYEVQQGQNLVLTSMASTVTSAAKSVYENIKHINYRGMNYRKDICININ